MKHLSMVFRFFISSYAKMLRQNPVTAKTATGFYPYITLLFTAHTDWNTRVLADDRMLIFQKHCAGATGGQTENSRRLIQTVTIEKMRLRCSLLSSADGRMNVSQTVAAYPGCFSIWPFPSKAQIQQPERYPVSCRLRERSFLSVSISAVALIPERSFKLLLSI